MNPAETWWHNNIVGHNKSRRFLGSIDGNFLKQVIKKTVRRDTLLDPILINKEELVRDVKTRGNLGSGECEIGEFWILRGRSQKKSRKMSLDFRREK